MSHFDRRLQERGLTASTREKYNDIIESAGNADLLQWITTKINRKTPIGTVLPMRAAVKHYLIAEMGYSAEELEGLLPEAAGASNDVPAPLTPGQLAQYHAAVDQIDIEPAHTILTLLPMTGLRISEICGLRPSDLQTGGLKVGTRVVPVLKSAEQTLERYITKHGKKEFLFSTYNFGGPIGPHGVRKYTRRIAEKHQDLAGLCPNVLRHTFAAMALRNGMDVRMLQRIMGHQSLQTTQRYLVPVRSQT